MKNILKFSAVLLFCFILTGCGTTSSMQSAKGKGFKFDTTNKYNTVIVETFTDKVTETDSAESEIKQVCEEFPTLIAEDIKKEGVFKEVLREGTPAAKTLVIKGEVNKIIRGNAGLRTFVGFGCGSSYLDAVVKFYDGSTNEQIGVINVNRNSWVLGGVMASGQDPSSYMKEASKKIAGEVKRLAE